MKKNVIEWATEWATMEDAEVNPAADFVAFMRDDLTKVMSWRREDGLDPVEVRAMYPNPEAHDGFTVFRFSGPCRRGVVIISEGQVMVGATIAGNGTPAAVWDAGPEDKDLINEVLAAYN